MRYVLLTSILVLIAGCSTAPGPQQPIGNIGAADVKPIDGLARYGLGEPISVNNVTIVPVVLTGDAKTLDRDYISLEEAKKEGLVEITEMPEGQEVNRLFVRNLSKRPLMLLAGQLLLGGKQDRVVAKDTVVPAGQEMDVPVYCVEHGRWTGETGKFDYSGSMAPQSVRDEANFGDQEQVWNSVSQYNEKAKVGADTSSVRGGLYSEATQSRVNEDLAKVEEGLRSQKNVVGLVYVVNGEIGSLELFGEPRLFEASKEPLIRGFLADAAVKPSHNSKALDKDEIAKFIKASLLGERRQTRLVAGSAGWDVDSDGAKGVESTVSAEPMSAKADAQNELLHGSYKPNR